MSDLTVLTTSVNRLADALRQLPLSRLERGPADEGLALARELARQAQRAEFPGQEPREMPDAGVFAVGDQLAVAGADLVEALRPLGDPDALEAALRAVGEASEGITGMR